MKKIYCLATLFLGLASIGPADASPTQDDNSGRERQHVTRPNRVDAIDEPENLVELDTRKRKRRSRLSLADLQLDADQNVEIQLMRGDTPMKFKLSKEDYDDDPFTSYTSTNHETGDRMTFVTSTTRDGIRMVTGTIHNANGTVFQIRQLADGEVIVDEIQDGFDRELEPPSSAMEGYREADIPGPTVMVDGLVTDENAARYLRTTGSGGRALQSGLTQIDVMVIYTKGAMCAAAGYGTGGYCDATSTNNQGTIESLINLAISETNTAYVRSGIPAKLRLVKTHFDATYDDYRNQFGTTLAYLKGKSDGQLDYIHSMRDQVGADFVSIMVDTGGYCGTGYRPDLPSDTDAFSVVNWSCATGYYSFGHELGHNMGCKHDHNNDEGSGSNFGYQYTAGSSYNTRFRTVMSYDCTNRCKRIQQFSDPTRTYNGVPSGDSSTNNAGWIRARLANYAAFRPAQPNVGTNVPKPVPTPVVPTKAPAPAPTSPPTNELKLETTFTGNSVGGAGNMFDVRAKKDLSITNFAVHANAATTVVIEIRKKKTPGSFQGSQSSSGDWEYLGKAEFVSNGAGQPSLLPLGSFNPVYVKSGDVQAFYLTFQASTNVNRYSSGIKLGGVYKENNDIQIFEGYAKGYLFGADYYPRVFNGQVFYEVGTVSQPPVPATPLPTKAPTPVPATPLPTKVPTPVPATPSPEAPTSVVAKTTSSITTTFVGGNGQAGNMFDVTTNKRIKVKSFDIHTYSDTSVRVLVFTKKGTYEGFEKVQTAWTKICDTLVYGAGSPNPTRIPREAVTSVTIRAGETQAFYVTMTDPNIRYTNGIVSANDGTVSFVKSSGVRYPFGNAYPNRIWNGVLYYVSQASSSQPTRSPVPLTGDYGVLKKHTTTMANKNGSYGSMFDIKAKTDLIISNLWFHTYHQFGAMVDVEIYMLKTKNTSWQGTQGTSSAWQLIGSASVAGQGSGNPTQLPPGTFKELKIANGDIQALYITIVGGGIRYTNGKSTGTVMLPFSESSDLIVYEGAGVAQPRFGGIFLGRVFNGIIEYYTPNAADTSVTNKDTAEFDSTGKKEEGWPCKSDDDCISGICGKGKQELLEVTGTVADSGERLVTVGKMQLCMNQDGVHDEDGDYDGLQ